jgi:cytochrome c oxidase assembly protein subunit 15
VGGLVRATGSGMGCPDWPKCFGEFIPPTSAEQLPADYKTQYVQQRIEKNERIVKMLNGMGFIELADRIKNDPNVLREEEFNAVKTWTEYINRLVGASIGVLVLATFITSFKYRKSQKSIVIVSGTALILTLFQAWIGSVVVSTNLLPGTITLHMVLALVIVNVLIYGAFKASADFIHINMDERLRKKLYLGGLLVLGLTIIQLVLGTQVREVIDVLKGAEDLTARSTWIEEIGRSFTIHRSFSWLVMIAGLYLGYLVVKNDTDPLIAKLVHANFGLIILQITAGVILEYFHMPPAFQVIHLVGIAVMVSVQFLLLLVLKMRTNLD